MVPALGVGVNAAADGPPHRPEVDGGHGGHHHRGRVMRIPSFVGLENLSDPQRGMRGARRLLQPKGRGWVYAAMIEQYGWCPTL